jgi:hypothetical protein
LQDVFQCAGPAVVERPAFQGEAFQPADVHVVDVYRVPDRLEDPVEEPKDDNPADELVGQEMVDPEDHRLGQLDAQDLVEVSRRCQAGAKGFLDCHRVRGAQSGGRQGRQDRREKAWGQREIDQRVRAIAADHPADVLRPGDVGGCEAEHPDHGVAGGRCHTGGVFTQPAVDVLAKVAG